MSQLAHTACSYISRYYQRNTVYYDKELTFALSQIFQLPESTTGGKAADLTKLPQTTGLQPLDKSGSFILQVSLEIVDGNNQDLKDRAVRQLMGTKEILKQAVTLTPGDRLALDTRISNPARRI